MHLIKSLAVLLVVIAGLVLNCATTSAQQARVLQGIVVDSASGVPLSAASVFVQGTKRGTFSSRNGRFRLPLEADHRYITVRSIGYKERTFIIPDQTDSLRFALMVSDLTTATVTVTAGMTPEELIRRAVLRKEENASRIKTTISTLYSKMRLDRDRLKVEDEEVITNSIKETFSKVYEQRGPNPIKEIVILQRRQTKDVAAGENLMAFDEFFDFTRDDLTILKTRLITPLGREALDEYNYTITNKRMLGDKIIYELSFEPKARIFPGFEGTLSIVEGTYQLIAASFAPTEETAFPFIRGLHFEQRYERYDDSIWVPAYLSAKGGVNFTVIAGLAEIKMQIHAQTYATDVQVNVPLPDSVTQPKTKTSTVASVGLSSNSVNFAVTSSGKKITVAPDADTAKSEFWDAHAFAEPSAEERAIYKRADSIAPKLDSLRKQRDSSNLRDGSPSLASGSSGGLLHLFRVGPVNVGLTPVLDRSTITDVMYGGVLGFASNDVKVSLMGAFGSKSTRAGSVEILANILNNGDARLDASTRVFSSITTLQGTRNVSRRFETLELTDLLFATNLDYFRRDGFDVAAKLAMGRANLSAVFTDARHINMPVIAEVNHLPIPADAGAYRTVQMSVGVGHPTFVDNLMGTSWPVFGTVSAMYGQELTASQSFSNLEVHVGSVLSTFTTGYHPMQLSLDVKGGIAVDSMPRQFQFNALRRYFFLGSSTDMATVPVNAYGGTAFVSLHAEHNFSDMWWRLLRLPTFNGRGIDIIAKFNAMNMVQRGNPVVAGEVYDSTNGWYTEAGFALSRIPSFVSDLLFLRFDALWPVGGLALPRGSFGWAITLSSPLL